MSSNHSSPQTASDWSLSLDLLIARAALDQSLRCELLKNPHDCCKSNGVLIPGDVRLVITSADQETIIREIPSDVLTTEVKKVSVNAAKRELATYNASTESVDVTTTATENIEVVIDECAVVTCEEIVVTIATVEASGVS
jgi:hypothetical protein